MKFVGGMERKVEKYLETILTSLSTNREDRDLILRPCNKHHMSEEKLLNEEMLLDKKLLYKFLYFSFHPGHYRSVSL